MLFYQDCFVYVCVCVPTETVLICIALLNWDQLGTANGNSHSLGQILKYMKKKPNSAFDLLPYVYHSFGASFQIYFFYPWFFCIESRWNQPKYRFMVVKKKINKMLHMWFVIKASLIWHSPNHLTQLFHSTLIVWI